MADPSADPFDEIVEREWERADSDRSGHLSLKEVIELLHKLNLKVSDKNIKQKFKDVDRDKSGQLNEDEFKVFLRQLHERPEIDSVFNGFSKDGKMDAATLHRFLDLSQKETNATVDTAAEIIAKFGKDGHLYRSGFTDYMHCRANVLANPAHMRVYQDMTQPLSHYWIAGSHNTYCTSDQLKGDSSVEMYRNALRSGCRCVEIDCWDGPDGQPIVYHGFTLTSKILFRDVIATIKESAFETSPYPVILSLENHCGVAQQATMAAIMREILGDHLPTEWHGGARAHLMSPDSLRFKVLLKGKLGKPTVAPGAEEDDSESDDPEDAKAKKKAKKGKSVKVSADLSALIHLSGIHFKAFDHHIENSSCYEMSSISEGKTEDLAKKSSHGFARYCSKFIARIYPKGSRFDSSNFDPSTAWAVGAQIVALNYQTPCKHMALNNGRFSVNGQCGYVLKPEYLRTGAVASDPYFPTHALTLTIQVISGWQFPKVGSGADEGKGEVIDPYVVIQINGIPADCATEKTKVCKNNGFNPVWKETFTFRITSPAVAMVTFRVYDYDMISKDDFIAYNALPLESMRKGFRCVRLLSPTHDPIPGASLFVQVDY